MVNDLKMALRAHGVDIIEAVLGTSIEMPRGLSTIPVDDPAAVGAAATSSLVPVLCAKRRSTQEAYRKSQVGYPFRVQQELEPHTLIVQIGYRVRSFIMGV
jgi:hypothetical protein